MSTAIVETTKATAWQDATDFPLSGPRPVFRYSTPWAQAKIIHALRVNNGWLLVVGDPRNGDYEWVLTNPDDRVALHSNHGYGCSVDALRDGLNQAQW